MLPKPFQQVETIDVDNAAQRLGAGEILPVDVARARQGRPEPRTETTGSEATRAVRSWRDVHARHGRRQSADGVTSIGMGQSRYVPIRTSADRLDQRGGGGGNRTHVHGRDGKVSPSSACAQSHPAPLHRLVGPGQHSFGVPRGRRARSATEQSPLMRQSLRRRLRRGHRWASYEKLGSECEISIRCRRY